MPIVSQPSIVTSSSQISPGVVETTDLADDAVTDAKLAHGTAGAVKSFDASGVPSEVAPGTSGKFLMSNGAAAVPTYETAGKDWEQLGEATADGTSATLAIAGMSARKQLLIYAEVVDIASASELRFRFNADSGTNYHSTVVVNGGAAADRTSGTGIEYSSAGGTIDYPASLVIHVLNNSAGRAKSGFWQAMDFPTGLGAAPGDIVQGGFAWNNTANQITGFSLVSSAGNLASGTTITVYGKKD